MNIRESRSGLSEAALRGDSHHNERGEIDRCGQQLERRQSR
jgi:hypothetical protein